MLPLILLALAGYFVYLAIKAGNKVPRRMKPGKKPGFKKINRPKRRKGRF